MPPYLLLYPPLPLPSTPLPLPLEGEAASDGGTPEANMPTRPGRGVFETATTPTFLRPHESPAHSEPTSPHSAAPCETGP
jgi:hypothetical protein